MKCSSCGKVTVSGAKFCTSCGAKLTQNLEINESQIGSVDQYFNDKHRSLIDEARALSDGEMKQGIIWFIIAVVVTGATWLFASEGGSYYIFGGAMIYGVYRLIRGFWYKMNPESL